jgi:hypothetical protein
VRGSRLVNRRLGCLHRGLAVVLSCSMTVQGQTHAGNAESILLAMIDGCHRQQQQQGSDSGSRCSSCPDLG